MKQLGFFLLMGMVLTGIGILMFDLSPTQNRDMIAYAEPLEEGFPMRCVDLPRDHYRVATVVDGVGLAIVVRVLDNAEIYNFVQDLRPELLIVSETPVEFSVPGANCIEN